MIGTLYRLYLRCSDKVLYRHFVRVLKPLHIPAVLKVKKDKIASLIFFISRNSEEIYALLEGSLINQ